MTLQHIELESLTISPLNARKYGAKDCADLVRSICALGLLQPLLVRPADDGFEVVAGQRRLNALRRLAEDGEGGSDLIPCLVVSESDNAAAIEASLAENIERLPMDEIDQFKAFTKLVKEGREIEDIAETFGITELLVTQRLALGRLYAPILTAYRRGDIHARDIRILTMATPKQQKAWWALVKDKDAYVPTGQRLKDWLFGGAHIPISNAIFDVEASGLTVVADLFGEDAYFANAAAFWVHQEEAIAMIATGHEVTGWREAIVLETGAYFATWDHRTCPKEHGGKVFITVSHQGEVSEHEGYITNAEAKCREKAAQAKAGEEQPKPELTKPAQNYVDLHRHAAVRADLLGNAGLALRLTVAHMLAGSDLWNVCAEPQKVAKPEIAESLCANAGQSAFEAEREAIVALVDVQMQNTWSSTPSVREVFARLVEMTEDDVTRVLTFVMAETLSVHSPLIDTLGTKLGTDMRRHWTPDTTFFGLVKDKTVLNTMVGEYAGEAVADGNADQPAKTQRTILNACVDGTRALADSNWTPRFMAFPQGSYLDDQATVEAVAPDEMSEAA